VEETTFTTCATAFGWVAIAASTQGLVAVSLPQADETTSIQEILARCPQAQPGLSPLLLQLQNKLQRYFQGEPVTFEEPLDFRGTTAFQQRVWLATRAIPRGQTRTYGQLAAQVGSPKAARAVGQALARNPWPVIVPCHRVVGHDGQLTGFGGGLEMKQRLLALETK